MKFWNKTIIDIYHPVIEYHKLDSFRLAMNVHYKNVSNPYFLPWMNCSIASLQDATYNAEKSLFETYLLHKPVQYNNEQYMNFFNSFFKDYVYVHSMKKDGENIRSAINQFGTYDALMGALKTVRLLDADDTLRELVMLKGLYELYDNPAYVPRNILAIAEQTSTQSKIPEHRQIARNMIAQFTKLDVGTTAPAFTAIDRKGNSVSPLQDFHGKYVFLHFYTSWNAHALQEMKLLIDLQKKYGKKIAFVSISLDQDTAAYKKFLAANPKYNWTMLHYNFNEQLKEDYQLFAYPAYFIIDDQGKFFEAPAESPMGNLEYKLWRICNPRRTIEGFIPGQRN
jgi:thiol-disulfide isomerase/thioredoxin